MTPLEAIYAALRRPAAYESSFKAEVERMAMADDLDGILALMAAVADLKTVVLHMEHVVGEAAVNVVPSTREKFPLPGGGTFRVTQAAAKKKVDHAAVVKAVAERINEVVGLRVVDENGEITDAAPVVTQIVATVAKVVGATVPSFTGWRTGALKELDIDLARFTEWEDAPLKPKIESRDAP
jgi:hypothetical protein